MPFEIPNPDEELVVGPGDLEDDFRPDTEGTFNLHEAIEMCDSFGELCSVLRDHETMKTDQGSEIRGEDVTRLVEQIAAKSQEDTSMQNEQELHSLVLQLPNIPGLVDKVLRLLNPGEEN